MENEADIPLDSFSCKDTSFRMNHQMGWLTVLVSLYFMPQPRTSSGVLERTRLRPPHSYAVIMHNDDQTTMDVVVEVLMQIFRLNYQQSMKVMLKVHKEGQCQVAKYRSLDMAQTKVRRAMQAAEQEGFPLAFSIEPIVED